MPLVPVLLPLSFACQRRRGGPGDEAPPYFGGSCGLASVTETVSYARVKMLLFGTR